MAGFLNSDGGVLVVGVKEYKDSDNIEIVGIKSEFNKLKDKTLDGYRRMILDEVIKPYLPSAVFIHFNNYFSFEFVDIDEHTILGIRVRPSDVRAFLKTGTEELFFVRIDASIRQISGSDLVDYCAKRFRS